MQALRALWTSRTGSRNASLDGLRGLAILLVIAGHASAGRFPLGGMVGVTLFFVLSGYLITSLLLEERRRNGWVDLRAFYVRRVLRLVPALCVMLLIAPAVLWLTRDPQLAPDLVQASLITVLYLSDFFRAAGDPLVVYGHTWSLAVEEQFYLLWPTLLLVVLLRRLSPRTVLVVVLLLAAGFAALRVWAGFALGFERAYFALDMNAFALLFGAVLSLRPVRLSARAGTVLAGSAAAGLLLVSCARLAPGTSGYYLGLTAGAVVAALLAVAAVAGARWAPWPWSFRPLVAVGRLSYGLYLWHEVFYLSKPGGEDLSGIWRGVALVASLALALLSWVLVEYPILQRKRRFERLPIGSELSATPLSDGDSTPIRRRAAAITRDLDTVADH